MKIQETKVDTIEGQRNLIEYSLKLMIEFMLIVEDSSNRVCQIPWVTRV